MSGVQSYRKLPVVIEAIKWDGGPGSASEVIDWILAGGSRSARWHEQEVAPTGPDGVEHSPYSPEHIAIDTLEGTMRADVGDYIIRGVQGEHYPCKPDIFEATYERVAG
jgi:hypothetical protein